MQWPRIKGGCAQVGESMAFLFRINVQETYYTFPFLDQKPSPFAPPGFVPFGRGEGGRGFPRAGRPLPPQESLFKSNLKKGSSEVIRNYRHTMKTYFGPHLNTLKLKYVLGDSSKWPPSYGVWSYQETVQTQCCQSDVGHSGWKSSSSH